MVSMRALALAMVLNVSLVPLPVSRVAVAQQPDPPRDTVPPDSVRRDSVITDSVRRDSLPERWRYGSHHVGGYLSLLAGFGVFAVIAIAPAPLAKWWGAQDSTDMAFWTDHRSFYGTVGGIFDEGQTWAHSVNVEVLRGGRYAELRVEDFYRPRHFQYITVRGGYLFHPKRGAAGGVTLGYRHAQRDPGQQGVEIGLPLFVAFPRTPKGTIRLEPSYAFAPDGAFYSYRFQVDYPVRGGPYVAGVSVVGKSVTLNPGYARKGYFASAVALLIGARL